MRFKMKTAEQIYFLNDMPLAYKEKYGEEPEAETKKIINEIFNEISTLFVSKYITNISYEFVEDNLTKKIKGNMKDYYDLVITLGGKGQTLFDCVKKKIRYIEHEKVKLKRCLLEKKLDEMKMGFIYDDEKIKNIKNKISKIKEPKILIVDDIIFSGNSITKAKEILDIKWNVDIITLLTFENILKDKNNNVYAGMYIKSGVWPDENQDLWCLRDLVEDDAVFFADGESTSFMGQKEFSKEYMFGDNYEKANTLVKKLEEILQNKNK